MKVMEITQQLRVVAVCMGQAEKIVGKSYKTGINKVARDHPVMIGGDGVIGDAVCNRKYHGGPEQAVLVEGEKTLKWWSEILGRPVAAGLFGENLVFSDLDNRLVAAGDTFRIGSEVILQATSPRTPCGTLVARTGHSDFTHLYRKALRPGIYCRVLKPGIVNAGDRVEHTPFDDPIIPIPEMLEKYGRHLIEEDIARYLSAPVHARLRAAILTTGKAKF